MSHPKNEVIKFMSSVPIPDETMMATQRGEDEIDLRAYWGIFNKYKWSLLFLTLLIGLITILVVFQLQPIYRSTATLLVETDKTKIISIEELYGASQMNDDFYQTQVGIIKSRPLAEKLVTKLALVNHKAFAPAPESNEPSFLDWHQWVPTAWLPPPKAPPTAEERYQAIINAVMANLTVNHVRNSQLMEISFESPDAKLVADVPNALADIYFNSDLDARLEMTKKASSWFTESLEKLRQKLAISEKTLQDYLDKEQLVDVSGVKSVATSQIGQISSDLISASKRLTEAETLYRQVQGLKDRPGAVDSLPAILNHPLVQKFKETEVEAERKVMEVSKEFSQVKNLRGSDAFASMPAVLENPLVQRLKEAELEAERKVSELSQRYGSKHPQMMAAQSEVAVARANTDQQIQRVIASAQAELKVARANTAKQIRQIIEGITKEYEVARANVVALQQAMSEKEAQIQVINHKEYQANIYRREVEANKQLYDLFLTRNKEADTTKDKGAQELRSIGRVIDPALVAAFPYKPKKSLIVGISLVLGFMFALMLAFLIEYLDNTIKNADDVEQKLRVPLLGTLPKMKFKKDKELSPRLMFVNEEKSPFAESIRTIRTGIVLSSFDSPHKVLVITSSGPGEGKTTFAINQAFALGQMAKTVLIDADMRRPSIGQTFGFSANKPGLSELVAGTLDFAKVVQPIEGRNTDLITSGTIPPNPLELLSSPRFEELLAKLREEYTYIVIDSPPVQAVSDARVIATHATAVAYVVRADRTPYKLIQDGLKQLRQANVPVLGVVLNQVDTKKLSKYYSYKYGYASGYHNYGYGHGYSNSYGSYAASQPN